MSQNLQNFVKFQNFQLKNLVDFEKCCKTHIFFQKSEPIQPKTSNILPKFCQPPATAGSTAPFCQLPGPPAAPGGPGGSLDGGGSSEHREIPTNVHRSRSEKTTAPGRVGTTPEYLRMLPRREWALEPEVLGIGTIAISATSIHASQFSADCRLQHLFQLFLINPDTRACER